MANTTNLSLVKPAGTDHALISDINGNMDIIDAAIGALPSGSNLQGEIDTLGASIGNLSGEVPHISTHTLSPNGTITIATTASTQYLLFFFSTSAAYMGMWMVYGRGTTAATVDVINESGAVTVSGHSGGGIDVEYSGSAVTAFVTMVKI